jgi:hypothetical protein
MVRGYSGDGKEVKLALVVQGAKWEAGGAGSLGMMARGFGCGCGWG